MRPVFFILLLLAGLTTASRPATVSYRLLPAASRLTWTGHAEIGSYAPSGTLQLQAGTFAYDGTRLRAARVSIDMRSLRHDNGQLQEHLRGADFFDVAQFPTAAFELLSAVPGRATGRLTIKGVTQTVTIPLTVSPEPAGALRLRGTVTIDRTQFGIRYNSTSFFANVGDQAIRNDFQLAFDLLAEPAR